MDELRLLRSRDNVRERRCIDGYIFRSNDGNEEEGSRRVAMNVKFLMEYIIALVEG